MEGGQVHVAMLPWLAFGHLLPFLQLSTCLARAGFRISFISTPKNIQRLPKLPQDLPSAHITFVELPLPHVDGLPEGAEATVDLPPHADDLLKKAYDLLLPHFHQFVARESPDFIVHDVLTHWTNAIAHQFRVPRVLFSIYSAAPIAFVGLTKCKSVDQMKERWPTAESMTLPAPWIPFPSTVAFLPHEAEILHGMFDLDASGISLAQRLISAVDGCEAIVLRSCEEYEGEYLDVLKSYPKPVIPLGLLPPEKRDTAIGGEWKRIFQWLDGKAPRSVVFVAFGSECKLSKSEVYEIAHGLESSGLDFLWALRSPEWAIDDSDALPPSFETRVRDRGIVQLGWAPQLEILAHPAIGGSLFHSGWGSIIETVQFGHPLVLLPLANVQGLDARLAVEKGLGVEVEREKDGKFHREAIAKALRWAMIEEEGEVLRLRSREMMAIFSDRRLHGRYLSDFVEFLRGYKAK